MRRALAAALVAVALSTGVGLCAAPPAGAAPRGDDTEPVRRLLIISLPTLSWDELDQFDAPNLEALLDQSAVADLSTRSVVRRTSPGDGYTTMDAGARARGVKGSDGLAFDVGERFMGYPVEQVFGRRTGQQVSSGIVNLGLPQIVAENDRLPYDAKVGALGDVLRAHDIDRAVIGNADGSEQELDVADGRAVGVGLMDSDGIVPEGSVGSGLLRDDAAAPFGQRLDLDEVSAVFDRVWRDQAVVLVEGSDLVRADAYRGRVAATQRREVRAQAIAWTDELVGRLLREVDSGHDAVMVVGPYHAAAGVHLTIAGLRAPGVAPGLLESAVTRRVGFVTLADVAPTVLDLFGLERPDEMEGRPWEPVATGASADHRRSQLADANDGALFRDSLVGQVSTLFVLAQLALCLLAVVVLRRGHARMRRVIEVASVSVLAMLPVTYLAGPLPFARLGASSFWLFLLVGSVAVGLICSWLRRFSPVDPLIAVLTLIVGLLVVDLVVGAPLQLNTIFGYTPTIAGRFAGLGNLAFAQLAAASLILAGLVAWRVGGRRGAWLGIAILVVAVVADGSPIWGSDVGGVLSFVPGAGITAMALLGLRVRIRTVVWWILGGIATMVAVGVIDLYRPEDLRTHLGRLFERIGSEGFGAFSTVVSRKLGANLAVLTSSQWLLMMPVVFTFVLYLVWRAPGRLHRIQEQIPQERASLYGFTVVAVLGFLLNDSGIAIPGMMLGVLNASLVHLVLVTDPAASPLVPAPTSRARRVDVALA